MTDRVIFYPDECLDDEQLLAIQQNAMIAQGTALASVMGVGTIVDGLPCTPTAPASLAAVVGLGSIMQLGVVEANAFGSLPIDTTPLVKQGWLGETPITFPLTAPATPGQSVAYLIEATLGEPDTGSAVLPFYNAANPSQAFAGPGNSGDALNTVRQQRCVLKLVPGAAANSGSQVTPAADPGYVPLWVITVAYGQVSVTAANIAQHPQAPFLPFKLSQLTPGFRNRVRITASSSWTLPLGYTAFRASLVGGGGGGGNCQVSSANNIPQQDASGSGGGAGGYTTKLFTGQTPGTAFACVVGQGGGPQLAGGTSSFGGVLSATGGSGAQFQSAAASAGAQPGVGSGGDINELGGVGTDGQSGQFIFAGNGGPSHYGGGGRAGNHGGGGGIAPGSAGGGAYDSTFTNTQYSGGAGAAGCIDIEW